LLQKFVIILGPDISLKNRKLNSSKNIVANTLSDSIKICVRFLGFQCTLSNQIRSFI